MTKIEFFDDNKYKKLDVGDFVSVNGAGYLQTDFAIIASRGAYRTVVNLKDGTDYGRWDTVEKMTDALGLQRIMQQFAIYPESEDDDD